MHASVRASVRACARVRVRLEERVCAAACGRPGVHLRACVHAFVPACVRSFMRAREATAHHARLRGAARRGAARSGAACFPGGAQLRGSGRLDRAFKLEHECWTIGAQRSWLIDGGRASWLWVSPRAVMESESARWILATLA
jgi:hypothetical protein